MKKILSKLDSFYIPFDTGKMALFFSILALAYVASASNTPCLSANTCAVGSDPVFEDNVGVKGGTAFTATIDASLITNDRNIQLPDTDGILAVTSTLAGNKMLRTNVSGEIEVDSTTYPVTLSPDLPLYTSATGEVTAGAFDVTLLGVGTGTSNQVLTVGGGSALTWSTITGVPTLTANKPLISDGLGALTTASLTADKIMVTDTNGNLDTTSVYPLSFSANKPVVTDAVGNLTDITLNANENVVTDGNGNLTTATLSPDLPVITDGNGNLATSLIDITTDIDASSASTNDEIRVGSGGALEYFTPSSGGIGRIVASGNMGGGFYGQNACWQTGSMPFTTNALDQNKEYRLMINWTQNYYNQAIPNGGAPNLSYQLVFGDDANNVGRQCDGTTSGNEAYGRAGWQWNTVSNRQPDTCGGTYYRMEGTSSSDCRYQSGYSPNYWTDSSCVLMAGSMPSSSYSAYDYLSFDKAIIDFSSQKNGIGVSQQYSVSGGFNSSDVTNSNYKATFSGKGSCNYGDANTGATLESFAGIKFNMWNDTNQVYSDIDWVLIEYN